MSVYPLNLVRTRLQASGSPAHPQRYTGVWDVGLADLQGREVFVGSTPV